VSFKQSKEKDRFPQRRKGAKKAFKVKHRPTPLRLCAFARDSFVRIIKEHKVFRKELLTLASLYFFTSYFPCHKRVARIIVSALCQPSIS
jgi:hypothetical protein